MMLTDKETLHDFVIATERKIRCYERYAPQDIFGEWTMFKTLSTENLSDVKPSIKYNNLLPIETKTQWLRLLEIRRRVEVEFGITDETLICSFVKDSYRKTRHLKGRWFLVSSREDEIVGQIGIIPFNNKGMKIGRLQDVDILKDFQGLGYGNAVLKAIESYANIHAYDALCLMAKADDWPKDWYQKQGFEKVGSI